MRYITPKVLLKHRLGNQPHPQWSAAILCFLGYKSSQTLVSTFNAQPLGYKVFYGLDEFSECPFVYEAIIGSKRVGIVTRCVWGGPQAAILVEELADLGVQYLIGYGAAGSIDQALPRGQQIIAGSAIPVDGTSQIYNHEPLLAESQLINATLKVGRDLQGDIRQVTAATVDALYRETKNLISAWRSQGVQIINMETAPFYAASIVCGVKSVWIGYVSDCLIDKWDSWFANQDESVYLSTKICLELVHSIFLSNLQDRQNDVG